jgi:hypothetical protein
VETGIAKLGKNLGVTRIYKPFRRTANATADAKQYITMTKNIVLITGFILLIANLLIGSILSVYPAFNMLLNSGVIIANTVLLYLLSIITLKDGFRISLSFLFSFFGLVEFILGLIAPQRYEDNGYLLAVILIVAFEAIVLVITHLVSKNV